MTTIKRQANKENNLQTTMHTTLHTERTPMKDTEIPKYMQGTYSYQVKRQEGRQHTPHKSTPIKCPETVLRSEYDSLESQMRIQEIVIAKLQLKISELKNDLFDNRSKFKASQLQIESLQDVIRLKDMQIHSLL